MVAERKLVRVQEKGQITLPADVRTELGLRSGDLVAVEVTAQGALVMSQQMVVDQALDEIGQALREEGLTLETLIESGREIRADLIREKYPDLNLDERE